MRESKRPKRAHVHAEHSLESLVARTKAAGLKLTPARLAILRSLGGSHRLLTIDELVRELGRGGEPGFDWSTVYRCLRKFEEAGIVAAVPFADGQSRYELKDDHGHHHHAICTECKTATPIEACSIGKLQASVAAMGFTSLTHRLEFFGLCAKCS